MNFSWQRVYIINADLLFADQYTNSVSNRLPGSQVWLTGWKFFSNHDAHCWWRELTTLFSAQAVCLFLFRQSSKKVVKLNLRDFIYFFLNSKTRRGLDECGAMDSRWCVRMAYQFGEYMPVPNMPVFFRVSIIRNLSCFVLYVLVTSALVWKTKRGFL